MKIVFALNSNELEAPIASHFGKSEWFCIYDSITQNREFIQNIKQNATSSDFCESAELFIEKGIHAAIANRFGSKIIEFFRSQNIQMIMTEQNKTAIDIIQRIK